MSQEKTIEKLRKTFDTLNRNVNFYIKSIEPHNYYDTDIYANSFNSQKCELLQQRLRYIEEGLRRYDETKDSLSDKDIKIDNKWMKEEMKSIQADYDKLKESIHDTLSGHSHSSQHESQSVQ